MLRLLCWLAVTSVFRASCAYVVSSKRRCLRWRVLSPELAGETATEPTLFEVGTRVRIVATDITFWHHPKSKEGFNPKGCQGVVKRIATVPRDGSETPISANRPICVMLDDPKLMAHFEADELDAL